MNWYPFYSGDYARDTAHLTMLEHGAYRLMLDHYYNTQAPLPLDRGKIYRVCRAVEGAEKAAIDTVLETFFQQHPEGWRSKKADLVVEQQTKKAEVNRERALKAVEGKRSKVTAPSSTPSRPNQNQNQNQNTKERELQPPPQPKTEKPVVVADENPISLEDLSTLYRFYHGGPNLQQQMILVELSDKFTSKAIVDALEASHFQAEKNPAAWVKSRLERIPGTYIFEKDPSNSWMRDLPTENA